MRPSIRFSLPIFVALVVAVPLLAQSYGPNDQVLTISSTEFRPIVSSQVFHLDADGNHYLEGGGTYDAPLHLPDGADITEMCVYSYDTDGTGVFALIIAMKLPVGGEVAGEVTVPGTPIIESFNIGFGTVCANPFSFTVLSDADLDGQGSQHLAYFLRVVISPTTKVGGVRIIWHRQVSPAPATADFADVPVGAFGFAQIEALFASGITGGCGGGNYCPDQNVTRAQMAVFLAKALGLYYFP